MSTFMILVSFLIPLLLLPGISQASDGAGRESCWSIARLKYGGGGDWYAGPTALTNLLARVRKDLGTEICRDAGTVAPLDAELYDYPILFMTGHGNVEFTPEERKALREYLLRGGLLLADDNYGMDSSFRREVRALFPNHALRELAREHPVFSSHHAFPKGLPKVHEHDGKRPQAFGIDVGGRTVLFYSYESDLTNGWEDASVHGNPESVRESALRMGVNLIAWFLQGQPAAASR